MRIGLSSYAFRYAASLPDQDLGQPLGAHDILLRAADLGCDVIQFCENVPLGRLSPTELDRLQALAADRGIAIEVGTRGLEPDHLRRYISLAARFGGRLRVVLQTRDVSYAEGVLLSLLPNLREAGVVLAIENHFDLTSESLASLVTRINAPEIAICLDTANSTGLLERPLETVRLLAPLAVQAHVKDYVIESAPIGYRITGRPLGEGWLPLPDVLAALRASPHDPDLLIELWLDPAEEDAETLDKESDWIRKSVQTLQRLLG